MSESYHPGVFACLIVFFFLLGGSSEIFDLISLCAEDIASHGFMVRWGLIIQSAAKSTCFFHVWQEDFPALKGEEILFSPRLK